MAELVEQTDILREKIKRLEDLLEKLRKNQISIETARSYLDKEVLEYKEQLENEDESIQKHEVEEMIQQFMYRLQERIDEIEEGIA